MLVFAMKIRLFTFTKSNTYILEMNITVKSFSIVLLYKSYWSHAFTIPLKISQITGKHLKLQAANFLTKIYDTLLHTTILLHTIKCTVNTVVITTVTLGNNKQRQRYKS